jgi:hypothetical protein
MPKMACCVSEFTQRLAEFRNRFEADGLNCAQLVVSTDWDVLRVSFQFSARKCWL